MKYLKPDGKYVSLNSSSYLNFFKGLLVSFIPKLNFEKKKEHIAICLIEMTKKLWMLFAI